MSSAWCAVALAGLLAAPDEARFKAVAAKLVEAINASDTKRIEELFSAPMRKDLPTEKAGPFFADLLLQKGKMKEVASVEVDPTGDAAELRVECQRGAWRVQLSLDEADLISGLRFEPAGDETPPPERNATRLRLPFKDEWYVIWGGATEKQNYHVTTRNQRRALDLVIHDAQGKSHRDAGARNEDFYAYGKEILAPGDGKVITVIDGVPDNRPGSLNPYAAVGNCVIIEHAPNEHSVLAHLQPRSIRVKPGQKVKAGDVLGKCGNSGSSSEPHLHFHLQTTAVLQDGAGFAPFFRDVQVTADGQRRLQKDHTPIQGERIRLAP